MKYRLPIPEGILLTIALVTRIFRFYYIALLFGVLFVILLYTYFEKREKVMKNEVQRMS